MLDDVLSWLQYLEDTAECWHLEETLLICVKLFGIMGELSYM